MATDPESFFRTVLDANPIPVLVVDEDVRIIEANAAAAAFLEAEPEHILRQRGGEVLCCIQAGKSESGCGHAEECKGCVIRRCVREAAAGRKSTRKTARLTLSGKTGEKKVVLLVTAAPFRFDGNSRVLLLLEDISEFMELRELVPICCGCKKIRQDDQYWRSVESFVSQYMDVRFSHSYCPECAQKVLDGIPPARG